MRERLIQYVELLFAAAPDAEDIKQEILQNTLDRYDDLIDQGKSPEAAYRLAISGIGDINEILGSANPPDPAAKVHVPGAGRPVEPTYRAVPAWKKILRAIGIFLYIISPTPLFVLSEIGMDTIGLCGLLAIVAVATVLMVISGNEKTEENTSEETQALTPQQELQKAIKTSITTIGLVVYFILSFLTNAWYITWLIFPITAATQGLIKACMDLKEASKYES